MKSHLKTLLKIVSFSILANSLCAQSSIPYEALSKMLRIADGSKVIENTTLVPIYLKSSDEKIDHTKLEFTLTNKALEKTQKLKFEMLKDLPIESLTIHDLEYIQDEYTVKLWIPLDVKAYKDWKLNHNQPKGSLSIVIGKVIASNIDIEDKRAEYRKKLEKEKAQKAPQNE